jgi:hypothetical protein
VGRSHEGEEAAARKAESDQGGNGTKCVFGTDRTGNMVIANPSVPWLRLLFRHERCGEAVIVHRSEYGRQLGEYPIIIKGASFGYLKAGMWHFLLGLDEDMRNEIIDVLMSSM